jgi:hypothetical protein
LRVNRIENKERKMDICGVPSQVVMTEEIYNLTLDMFFKRGENLDALRRDGQVCLCLEKLISIGCSFPLDGKFIAGGGEERQKWPQFAYKKPCAKDWTPFSYGTACDKDDDAVTDHELIDYLHTCLHEVLPATKMMDFEETLILVPKVRAKAKPALKRYSNHLPLGAFSNTKLIRYIDGTRELLSLMTGEVIAKDRQMTHVSDLRSCMFPYLNRVGKVVVTTSPSFQISEQVISFVKEEDPLLKELRSIPLSETYGSFL